MIIPPYNLPIAVRKEDEFFKIKCENPEGILGCKRGDVAVKIDNAVLTRNINYFNNLYKDNHVIWKLIPEILSNNTAPYYIPFRNVASLYSPFIYVSLNYLSNATYNDYIIYTDRSDVNFKGFMYYDMENGVHVIKKYTYNDGR